MKTPRQLADQLPAGRGVNFAAFGVAGTEAEFQAAVVALAERSGWSVYHVPDSRRATCPGFPDLVLMRRRVIVVAELKRAGKKPRADQAEWLAAFEASGIQTHHWQPADWPAIEAALA